MCCINSLWAQQNLNASGGNATGAGGFAAYSIGQIVYTPNMGANGSAVQGVQQPYEISVTTGIENKTINLNLLVDPNPTINNFVLQTETYSQGISYELFDLTGAVLESKNITSKSTFISTEQFAAGTYILKVNENNKVLKTFRIIKKECRQHQSLN